jgi:hypothetical protein
MLLHWNIFMEWFVSNSKEKFKIYLKSLGNNWKKKKKCFPFHSCLSAHRPNCLPFLSSPPLGCPLGLPRRGQRA